MRKLWPYGRRRRQGTGKWISRFHPHRLLAAAAKPEMNEMAAKRKGFFSLIERPGTDGSDRRSSSPGGKRTR